MPAKGTGGKHLEPKEKKDWKEKKQWVKRSGTRIGPGTVKTAQKKAEKAVVAKAKSNRDATQKMYAAESMFKSAKARDDAKVQPGKARPFKEAYDDATSKGKERFLWKGKSFLTTKGKRAERFPVTTDKKSAATPKKSWREKVTGFKTQKEWEDARDKRRIEKRISNMKKRKNQGKNYSAKNLAELEAKLKDM